LIYNKKEKKYMADNVLNLSAFGEIIEPAGKRKYNPEQPKGPEVETDAEIIPLKPISIPKTPSAAPDKTQTTSSKTSQVASRVLQNMTQAKLLHWQTNSYSEHKALDNFFEEFIEISDTLIESIMGKYGRPVFNDSERTLKLDNYDSPESPDGLPRFIAHLDVCYREECISAFDENKDPEIFNIIQEILSLIDQTKYLLSLK
jgi:hypothetical protein